MAKKLEAVKLDATRVQAVRDRKKSTGVPIATFIEKAIDKELAKQVKQ